jgi:lipid-A-disaccharide synthase
VLPGKQNPDCVVQLGGDLFFGRMLASRTGVPLFSYSYGAKKGLDACRQVFTACDFMAGQIMEASGLRSVEVVGDLVADGLRMDFGEAGWKREGLRVALFPGSRPAIRKKALAYMEEFLVFARRLLPGTQWMVLLYPFCEPDEAPLWEMAGFTVSRAGTGATLEGAEIALTQPGTNTLELLHAEVPSVVALPEAFLENVPAPTMLAPFFRLPGIGREIKRKAFRKYVAKRGFLSWPNRIAGEELFPEITGELSPEALAKAFARYARDRGWIENTRELLGRIDRGPSNAAARLRERIIGALP